MSLSEVRRYFLVYIRSQSLSNIHNIKKLNQYIQPLHSLKMKTQVIFYDKIYLINSI